MKIPLPQQKKKKKIKIPQHFAPFVESYRKRAKWMTKKKREKNEKRREKNETRTKTAIPTYLTHRKTNATALWCSNKFCVSDDEYSDSVAMTG